MIDPMRAFYSFDSSRELFKDLLEKLDGNYPLVAVLSLEGLYRIESVVKRGQMAINRDEVEKVQNLLQHLTNPYPRPLVRNFLKRLTVFKKYGTEESQNLQEMESDDTNNTEDVKIFADMIQNLLEAIDGVDLSVAVLFLEGLYRVNTDLEVPQEAIQCFRNYLRRWRFEFCNDGLYCNESFLKYVARDFLKSLTVFKTLQVPLFIDTYGTKELLSAYSETEDIDINGETPVCHVTHSKEAKQIKDEKHLKPSDSKNSIEGCWFGIDNNSTESVYGTWSFKTELSKLGVTGLHQGEVVRYKNEVNVILYAETGDAGTFERLRKPTDLAVKKENNTCYTKVSIFVPRSFLPKTPGEFEQVIIASTPITHSPICVRALRSFTHCPELE